MIRDVTLDDSKEIAEIYNYYILNSIVTFEEVQVTEDEIKKRIQLITLDFPWIVYLEDGKIIGFAYANKWKQRSAYKHATESTVYLKHGSFKKGIGTKLYHNLIERLKNNNFHAIIGGISLPNEASIGLHEKLGFAKVAHFKEVGFKFEKWVDVGYWELLIN